MGNSSAKETEAVNFSREAAKRAGREAYRKVKAVADQAWADALKNGTVTAANKEAWEAKTKQVALEAARRAGKLAAELAVKRFKEVASQAGQGRTRGLEPPPGPSDALLRHTSANTEQVQVCVSSAAEEIRRRSNHILRQAAKAAVESEASKWGVDSSAAVTKAVLAVNKHLPLNSAFSDQEQKEFQTFTSVLQDDSKAYLHSQAKLTFQYIKEGVNRRSDQLVKPMMVSLKETNPNINNEEFNLFTKAFNTSLNEALLEYEQQDQDALKAILSG